MLAATRAGDGWLWYLCGFVLLFAHEYRAFAAAAASVAAGIAIFKRLKTWVGRARPCALEPHCWAELLPPDRFSFPSGHTITAFAIAVSLGSFYHTVLPALLFCAVSVAASRILLGMHFLSDVIAGAALGCTLGYAAVLVFT
jgi:undecaprenyl-diphosphatase